MKKLVIPALKEIMLPALESEEKRQATFFNKLHRVGYDDEGGGHMPEDPYFTPRTRAAGHDRQDHGLTQEHRVQCQEDREGLRGQQEEGG